MLNSSKQKKDYKVLKILGSGSFGIVYLVKKLSDQRLYALKQIKLKHMQQSERDKALNQIRLLASLDSPYIIKYHDSFVENNQKILNIVMEYAEEGDLEQKIENLRQNSNTQGFQEDDVLRISYSILRGLQYLHQRKIVHRDLKSANIFLSNQNAKIGDFNISKIIDKELCSTQAGTPYYIAPQVWLGKKYDEKCDIWAFGCLVYEMCTLKTPFRAKEVPGLVAKIMNGYYTPISANYSQKISKLIKRCLSINPSNRPNVEQLLQNSCLRKYQQFNCKQNGNERINLLETIRCPRKIEQLNKRLPKNRQLNGKKNILQSLQSQRNQCLSYDREIYSTEKKIDNKFRIKKYQHKQVPETDRQFNIFQKIKIKIKSNSLLRKFPPNHKKQIHPIIQVVNCASKQIQINIKKLQNFRQRVYSYNTKQNKRIQNQ